MTDTIGGDAAQTPAKSNAPVLDTPAPRPKVIDLPKPSRVERWGMNPEDRARVMEACLLIQRPRWKSNFGLMMLMAVVVAIMGLSANSAAVVIGAMLIAPLMTPVLGIAASIAMALGPALLRSVITVVVATLGAIGLGYLAGLMPGVGTDTLSPQILARTTPDIRDLFVAIAAGVAGSYATARPDVSSSLPGVAVAVALVPPLGVVGLALEAGRLDLAGGALLLYITNLSAIVAVSTVVFVLAGFVPARRLAEMTPRVVLGGLVALAILVGAGTLLTQRSIEVSNRNSQEGRVAAAVNDWLTTGLEVENIEIAGTQIDVEVVGPNAPADVEQLRSALDEIIANDTEAELEVGVLWTQATRAVPGSRTLLQGDLPRVQQVVEEWLEADLPNGTYDITTLGIEDDVIRIAVSSSDPLPPVEDLQVRLSNNLGVEPAVQVEWLELSVSDDTTDTELAELRVLAQNWAAENGVSVDEVRFDGDTVDVELVGAVAPPVAQLDDLLVAASGGAVTNIWFTERIRIVAERAPAFSGAWWPPGPS